MKLMLKRFEVENFRGFGGRYVFNLEAGQYGFNQAVVYNGIVKNALVYGINGSGKTTLGLALFDVVSHLTDNTPLPRKFLTPFCNLKAGEARAKFQFVFKRGEGELVYSYEKGPAQNLLRETLSVDGEEFVNWDYTESSTRFVKSGLAGSLNIELPDDKLSVIKYISKNTPTGVAAEVSELTDFISNMLWFRQLDGRFYAGIRPGEADIVTTIQEHDALSNLEEFLHGHGLDYHLDFRDDNGTTGIVALFDGGKEVDLFQIASSGTISLILYFAWSVMAFDKASLVFIDEFDAFLHFESALTIVRDLTAHTSFQSIVTTHNVSLLSNETTRPDCCFLIGPTKISSFAANSDRKIREAHNLEKMYVNGLFAES